MPKLVDGVPAHIDRSLVDFRQLIVEHLFPTLRMAAGGVRYHTVEIK
jgi:hypothetical protein